MICQSCGADLSLANAGIDNFGENGLGAAPPATGGNRNPLALVVVAVVAAAMLYFGFHMARRSGPAPPPITKSRARARLHATSLDGTSMRLSDLRGKAVLLNFWATWCSPCKIEMPWFIELQKQYGAQGLQIVGVAMGHSSKEDIAKFAKDMGVNYPVLLGKEEVGDAYGGVPALPETFFISAATEKLWIRSSASRARLKSRIPSKGSRHAAGELPGLRHTAASELTIEVGPRSLYYPGV